MTPVAYFCAVFGVLSLIGLACLTGVMLYELHLGGRDFDDDL